MLFKNITILDENLDIKNNMFVRVEEDKIVYIGKTEPEKKSERVIDGNGKLLMSGFFNAHAHSPMTLMRGYGENMNLQDWLFKKVFPFEDHLSDDAVYYGTLLAHAESLKAGIVSTSDMYFFMDAMVKASVKSEVKTNIGRSISVSSENPWEASSMQEMERAFKAYHNISNGKIKIDTSVHSEYTCGVPAIIEIAKFAKENNATMQIHISETLKEHEECKERHNGMTPVELFDSLGAWDVNAIAAHCVYIEDKDFDIMKEKKVTCASNPISNLKLASGVCNVQKFIKNGINIAIGTDSVCSNNSLNFFEEMKVFALSSKMMYKDPTAVTPKEALFAATRAGAIAQGRDDCGLVKEGFKADLIIVDLDVPNMYPVHDLLNNLVYSADTSQVLMTIVDGKILYENGEFTTIDLADTIEGVTKETNRILSLVK